MENWLSEFSPKQAKERRQLHTVNKLIRGIRTVKTAILYGLNISSTSDKNTQQDCVFAVVQAAAVDVFRWMLQVSLFVTYLPLHPLVLQFYSQLLIRPLLLLTKLSPPLFKEDRQKMLAVFLG